MGEGKRVSDALREKKLITSKSEDMQFMQQERQRLDEMERQRLAELATQKAKSSKEQTMLIVGSFIFVCLVVIGIIVVIALFSQ